MTRCNPPACFPARARRLPVPPERDEALPPVAHDHRAAQMRNDVHVRHAFPPPGAAAPLCNASLFFSSAGTAARAILLKLITCLRLVGLCGESANHHLSLF